MVDLSVVLPIHNEEKNILPLYTELVEVLSTLPQQWELIMVDDGSRDGSFSLLAELSRKDKRVLVVKLLSNYGQSTALAAGIDHAHGKRIVTMDADLQHDPKDIISVIEPLEQGFQVVCGWRKQRGDSFVRRAIPSRIANWLVNRMTGLRLHDSVGGMKAFTKEVAENVPLYGNMHRYLPIMAKWKGFRVTERPIHIRPRRAGKTHYTVKRLFGGFLDLLTIKFFVSYSTRPLRFFAPVGLLSLGIGVMVGLYYVIRKLLYEIHLMEEVASLILSVLLIVLGVLFIFFGFIADMISFDAIANKKRKIYLVEKIISQ